MHLVPELFRQCFLRYRMQVAERRNFMGIFYINCFSHSLYLSRARNISCFSCFLTIIHAIYMPKLNTSGGKGKIKTQGDT